MTKNPSNNLKMQMNLQKAVVFMAKNVRITIRTSKSQREQIKNNMLSSEYRTVSSFLLFKGLENTYSIEHKIDAIFKKIINEEGNKQKHTKETSLLGYF